MDSKVFLILSIWPLLSSHGCSLAVQSLALSKQLIRGTEKERLHTVNDQEVERLVERWLSDECMQAIMSFFQAKAKLWGGDPAPAESHRQSPRSRAPSLSRVH